MNMEEVETIDEMKGEKIEDELVTRRTKKR
jgi:hypothetical protein